MVLGHAVKTLESKETRASKKITITHNSVFAAHRLQLPDDDSQDRHPAFLFFQSGISSEVEESLFFAHETRQ
jgi:hypothetical protein